MIGETLSSFHGTEMVDSSLYPAMLRSRKINESTMLAEQEIAPFRMLEEANMDPTADALDSSVKNSMPFWLQIILIIILIMMSGLFSGLTLGLMSLDKTGLEIVMEGDDPVAAKNARAIYPIRSNGNLLLTTL